MFFNGLLKKKQVFYLMLCLSILLGISPRAGSAMPIDSQLSLQSSLPQQQCLDKINGFLQKQAVQQKLEKMGLSKEAVDNYLSRLTPAQLEQISAKIDTVESGGSSAIGILIIIVLIFIAVLYFTDSKLKIEPKHKSK